MRATISSAALLAAAATAVVLPGSPASAGTGCVSNAHYAQLANGQTVSHIRSIAGDDAQTGYRTWNSGANSYQERLYAMCTPTDAAHATLTTRFLHFQGQWRAQVVDTHIGPE